MEHYAPHIHLTTQNHKPDDSAVTIPNKVDGTTPAVLFCLLHMS
jgi:hypothetical protein